MENNMLKKYLFSNYNLFVFKLGMFFLLFLFVNIVTGNQCQSVTYSIEMDEENWNSFYISITIENNKNDQLLCTLPMWTPYSYSTEKFYKDISEFKVVGDIVQDIEIKRTNNNSWLINSAKNNLIIISYKIKRKNDSVLGKCISRDFAWINNASMFMYIRELENVPINLVISVPHGWKLATGLKPLADNFEYSALNYNQLIQHPIYTGTFNEIFFGIRKGNGYILIDGPNNFNAGKLPTIAKQVAAYQTYLLMSPPLERYLFIFKIFSKQQEIKSLAFQNSSIFYLPRNSIKNNLNYVGKIVASSFFKRWFSPQFLMNSHKGNYFSLAPRTSLTWFFNGISDYYGSLSMIRGGFWSQEDFIKHYNQLINRVLRHPNYLKLSATQLSCTLGDLNNKETVEFVKIKGELLCLLMDLKIRDRTTNQKNFDDVVRFIKNWYYDKQISFNDDDLLTTLNSVTSVDLTTFFDLYVNGNLALPFSEYFKLAGIGFESKIDTIPNVGRIMLDKNNKVIQLEKNGPLNLAGLRIGDYLLSINDVKFWTNEQLLQLVDSLKVDSDTEMTIRREGLSLIISAKVLGKEVEVANLNTLEKETDHQKLIRESWLSGRRLNLKKRF